jgi:hypothetical protein
VAQRSGTDFSGNKMSGSCSPRKAGGSKGKPSTKSKDNGGVKGKDPARQY